MNSFTTWLVRAASRIEVSCRVAFGCVCCSAISWNKSSVLLTAGLQSFFIQLGSLGDALRHSVAWGGIVLCEQGRTKRFRRGEGKLVTSWLSFLLFCLLPLVRSVATTQDTHRLYPPADGSLFFPSLALLLPPSSLPEEVAGL